MSSSSTLYTIGTALNRALDNEIPVHLLVGGAWLSGQVVALDGFGVVVNSDDNEHSVIRVDAVSAVKIGTLAPVRTPITTTARPMPAPRQSADQA
jgi:sRNA-binding regulator protein Hfq